MALVFLPWLAAAIAETKLTTTAAVGEGLAGRAAWAAMLDYVAKYGIPEAGENDRMARFGDAMRGQVDKLLLNSADAASLRYFADRFGRDGAKADYAWFVGGRGVVGSRVAMPFPKPSKSQVPEWYSEVRKSSGIVQQTLVERLCADPGLRQRYVQAQQFLALPIDNAEQMMDLEVRGVGLESRAHLPGLDGVDKAALSLEVVWLAHVTSREDLFSETAPGDLWKKAATLGRELRRGGTHSLVPRAAEFRWEPSFWQLLIRWDSSLELPGVPFPDWKGPAPAKWDPYWSKSTTFLRPATSLPSVAMARRAPLSRCR